MSQTAIQWASHVWNPFTGCDRVSPGCRSCYAAEVAEGNQRRERGRAAKAAREGKPPPVMRYQNDGDPKSSGPGFGFTVHWDKLENPERFPAGARVFVNSMSDVFHEQAPVAAIARLWAVFLSRPDVDWLVLTKRPERMREVLTGRHQYRRADYNDPCSFSDIVIHAILDWARESPTGRTACERVGVRDFKHFAEVTPWPLSNVWAGVSIENRRFVHRADVLRETPVAVRWISAEPLLGPLLFDAYWRDDEGVQTADSAWSDGKDLPQLDLTNIGWLVVGGESGKNARRCEPAWIRDLVWACRGSGTAPFVKQLGRVLAREFGCRDRSHGGDIDEWPDLLRVREMPQTRAAIA